PAPDDQIRAGPGDRARVPRVEWRGSPGHGSPRVRAELVDLHLPLAAGERDPVTQPGGLGAHTAWRRSGESPFAAARLVGDKARGGIVLGREDDSFPCPPERDERGETTATERRAGRIDLASLVRLRVVAEEDRL